MGSKFFRQLIVVMLFCIPLFVNGQNFYKENKPKTLSVFVGLGAGTFYAAPRPYTDSLVNQVMPALSLGLEKRLGGHISIKSQTSFQAFGNKEYSISEETVKPLYQGISYAWELTPTFNCSFDIMKRFHQLKKSV